jgi:hypothetical protein
MIHAGFTAAILVVLSRRPRRTARSVGAPVAPTVCASYDVLRQPYPDTPCMRLDASSPR